MIVLTGTTMYIKSCKLIDFNFRFLHRSLTSDSDLRKIGIREDRKCTLHYKEKDLMHLFWQYEKKKMFWQNLSIWLHSL